MGQCILYSIHRETGKQIIHVLPWDADSPQLKKYLDRGYSYTPLEVNEETAPTMELPLPVVEEVAVGGEVFKCEICGKEFGAKIALLGHLRSHAK